MSMNQKLKAIERCQPVAASVKDCSTAFWSASRGHWGSNIIAQRSTSLKLFQSTAAAWG